MKKFLIVGILLLTTNISYGQIGIGVSNSDLTSEELQINGNLIITNKVGQVNKLEELLEKKTVNNVEVNTDYRVVAQDPNLVGDVSGQIKEMYGQQNVLPIIIQPYEIQNVNGDDLDDLNLNIPLSDYFVAITNFEAVDNLKQGFPAVASKGRFEYNAFVGTDNMWHVKVRNPSTSPANTTNAFNYYFDVLIYPNRFFKNLNLKSYNLNNSKSGDAVTPIVD
ncbi:MULTISPECIES: hypothetical protein [Empedobacter]|uniref:Uncharacterized protein n=1 Tax=Empedobacter falsenii TaxID=343874 RepID=A0A7H9DT96_9FLAO|nr:MULTISPECIES: hypothetical protein [Empedobacter]MDH2208274.1 hypothetical protein [Empedobacter sp. GD03644]QLL57956.1 hypothetical protein FH779_07635 [Empedobacter falsenii]